jgi:pimeloyl-ACP methyl ester carboxylesterase
MTTLPLLRTLPRFLTRALAPLLLLGLLAGCATPVGVTRISSEESYRQSTSNPLNEGKASNATHVVLQRYDLTSTYRDDPVSTIRFLHKTALGDERRDILFALAELSYLHGERLRGSSSWDDVAHAPDYFLLSAIYAYLYLLGDGPEPPPTAWDVQFREACDLYNRALGRGFPADENGALTIGERVRKLPIGELTIIKNVETLNWNIDDFTSFLPANNYEVSGFTVRNRTSGLGLPLIATLKQSPESPNGGALPVTAFLRIPGGLAELGSGKATATLELYSAYDSREVRVNSRMVPLETDSTAPLAYRLNDSAIWSLGLKRFLSGGAITNNMILIQPYEPGRIPVVFVHGTASSPVWWAEMLNTLRADPVIRKRFQFWFYQYNSSRMVLLSAADLRDTLTTMVKKLDPEGKDPAMRQMVVVGHSQGGLLTKMTAVAPGDRLWKAISDKNIDEMDAGEDIKTMVRRMAFFEPLPFVTRVIFISTPHRGSFLTKEWVRNLVRRIITIPVDILTLNPQLYTELSTQLKLPATMRNRVPTSIDGMASDNPILQTMATLPLAPGVTGHSIVAVLPGMEIKTGNDGVVEYKSAHIEGVESEFIVRYEHSAQGHPFAIEEVRRILREHINLGKAVQHRDTVDTEIKPAQN